jgi:hypothetical protein
MTAAAAASVCLIVACSCGFAGCCLIRLTVGLHHYPDIQAIADADVRAAVELRCLQLGQQLLKLGQAAAAAAAYHDGHDGGAQAVGGGATTGGIETIQQVVQLVERACARYDRHRMGS